MSRATSPTAPAAPLSALFGEGVAVAQAAPAIVDDQLFAEELAYARGASPKRRAEFGMGRVCARRALVALGLPPAAIVPVERAGPRWPRGVVGSITHTRDVCAAVVARSPPVVSLGLDVETVRPLDRGVRAAILTDRELRSLRAHLEHTGLDEDALVMLLFSAKEAYYKCQHPLTGVLLDFHDVEVTVEVGIGGAPGTFEARALPADLPARVRRLRGRFLRAPGGGGGMVACGLEIAEYC